METGQNTYKLLIVDDEALARYAFRTLISKNFDNIEVAGEAESGREAIELNRSLKPDIVIMDIKIPGINGIDASREILKEFPNRKILILTAYDNFSYIQQALDIGVKGYLLKPLRKEEVVEKINKVLAEITSNNEKVEFKARIEDKIKVVKPFIQKELVSSFITGTIDINEIKSYINFLQDRIEAGYFMLISLGENDYRHINDSIRYKIYRDKVFDVVSKHLPNMKRCIFGHSIGNTVVVFFPLEKSDLGKPLLEESLHIAQEIKSRVKLMAGLDVAIGIGTGYAEIENFHQSYNEANNALRKAMGQNGIVHYKLIREETDNNPFEYPVRLEGEILEQLRMGGVDKAKELVNDMLSQIFNHSCNLEIIKDHISQFITMLKRTVSQLGMDAELFRNTGALVEISQLKDFDAIKIWSRNSIFTIIERFEALKESKGSGIMSKVYDCIRNPYRKDITLEMVAGQIGLSPQYLSKIFKEESGANFIDYITEKRISFAKELLKNGDKNIKEISSIVGYEDANYFCRIFKKSTGLTPKEYRRIKDRRTNEERH